MAATNAAARPLVADADTLAREAPYSFDDEMKALIRPYVSAGMNNRWARVVELLRRMIARAEAAWPAHSLFLASLRLQLTTMLATLRTQATLPDAVIPAPTEEECALLRRVDDVIIARLDAGTLLRSTPSETALDAEWTVLKQNASRDAPNLYAFGPDVLVEQRSTCSPHTFGYRLACNAAGEHAMALMFILHNSNHLITDVVVAHAGFTLGVLRVVAQLRGAAATASRRSATRDVSDLELQSHEFFRDELSLMRAMALVFTAGPFDNLPGIFAPLYAAYKAAEAALDPSTVQMANGFVLAKHAEGGAHINAQRARWTPRKCSQCGVPESEPRLYKMCSRCGATAYCSRECQAAHWKAGHKKECRSDSGGGAAGIASV